jgi:hypothetical protein
MKKLYLIALLGLGLLTVGKNASAQMVWSYARQEYVFNAGTDTNTAVTTRIELSNGAVNIASNNQGEGVAFCWGVIHKLGEGIGFAKSLKMSHLRA